jgi:MFS family permease
MRSKILANFRQSWGSDNRPRAYGLIYWAINLGASVAALIGRTLAAYSYRALFTVDAVTTVLYGVLAWYALPETRPRHLYWLWISCLGVAAAAAIAFPALLRGSR